MRTILAAIAAGAFVAQAYGQENVTLKNGAGRETVESSCSACHSLDYLPLNSPFLNRQGWEKEVNKMIKAFGAPIESADATIIIDYLATYYGNGS